MKIVKKIMVKDKDIVELENLKLKHNVRNINELPDEVKQGLASNSGNIHILHEISNGNSNYDIEIASNKNCPESILENLFKDIIIDDSNIIPLYNLLLNTKISKSVLLNIYEVIKDKPNCSNHLNRLVENPNCPIEIINDYKYFINKESIYSFVKNRAVPENILVDIFNHFNQSNSPDITRLLEDFSNNDNCPKIIIDCIISNGNIESIINLSSKTYEHSKTKNRTYIKKKLKEYIKEENIDGLSKIYNDFRDLIPHWFIEKIEDFLESYQ